MGAQYQPGDVVTLSPEFYVYELLDDDDRVFYVGRTWCPQVRLRQHFTYGTDAIKERLNSLKEPRMRIVAGPCSEEEAQFIEAHHIREAMLTCELLNQEAKPVPRGRQERCDAVLRFAGLSR